MLSLFSRRSYHAMNFAGAVSATDDFISHVLDTFSSSLEFVDVGFCPNITVLPVLKVPHSTQMTSHFEWVLKPDNNRGKRITVRLNGNLQLFAPEHHPALCPVSVARLFYSAFLKNPEASIFQKIGQLWNGGHEALSQSGAFFRLLTVGFCSEVFRNLQVLANKGDGCNEATTVVFDKNEEYVTIFALSKVQDSGHECDGKLVWKITDLQFFACISDANVTTS